MLKRHAGRSTAKQCSGVTKAAAAGANGHRQIVQKEQGMLFERRFNTLHVFGAIIASITATTVVGVIYLQKTKTPLYINRDEAVAREIYFLPDRQHITFFSSETHPHGGQILKQQLAVLGGDTDESWKEADAALRLALEMHDEGKNDKASKLFRHALQLNPYRADLLAEYGAFLADVNDPVRADTFIMKALILSPQNEKALQWRRRTQPVVEAIDQQLFDRIERKKRALISLASLSTENEHPGLRRAINELYFEHIYHTCAIEGNTMSLEETRQIIKTHMAVYGKSVQEHGEIIGLDAALSYINSTLVRDRRPITLNDILDIHLRVVGYADPVNAGRLRTTQVFVSNHVPPSPLNLTRLMDEYLTWLNSDDASAMHPIKLAAVAHYWLAWLHPFYDGNGRTSRLLMNLLLMRAGYPPIIIKLQDRHYYFEKFKEANEGDVRWFYRFIANVVERTMDQYLTIVVDDVSLLKRLGVNVTDARVVISNNNAEHRLVSTNAGDETVPDGVVLIPTTSERSEKSSSVIYGDFDSQTSARIDDAESLDCLGLENNLKSANCPTLVDDALPDAEDLT